jgi:hypothetical protein
MFLRAYRTVRRHSACVSYVFASCTAKAILPDVIEIPLARKQRDVFYSQPVTHRIANTGTTAIHNLIVEIRQ